MATIKATKAALRKEIHSKLLKLTAEQKKLQSDKVAEKLFHLPAFESSKRVSIYLSTDGEISTDYIVKKLFELGKACFVPRYDGNVMQMVRLTSMKDWEDLPLTKWNIKQPSLKDHREDALESGGLDLIIMPGVAFTAGGKRLGHGKGYYDSFLTKVMTKQAHPATTVALAFQEQMLSEIPTHDHDVIINSILYAE